MTYNTINARLYASHVLVQTLENGHRLKEALANLWEDHPTANEERTFIQDVCYGVVRQLIPLTYLNQELLLNTIKTHDYLNSEVQALILIGLYQITYTRSIDHDVVNETVAAANTIKKESTANFINDLLVQYLNNKTTILEKLQNRPEFTFAHPTWMLNKFQQAWPDHWEKIVEANNTRPPLCIRVNRLQMSREEYLKILAENHIDAQPIPHTSHGVQLIRKEGKHSGLRLPGSSEGLFSFQDPSCQLAINLLDLQPGQRVLDACAAPGGKTSHILETEPKLSALLALDIEQKRVSILEENLKRLNLSAECMCGDASTPEKWWDGQPFDRILLDVPCSSTGAIMRRPDIKWLCKEENIPILVQQQKNMLEKIWPLLKTNGLLVYSTCSILPEENTCQIENFLKGHKDAEEVPITAEWGIAQPTGRQILQHPDSGMSGFYYVVLRKKG